MAEVNASKLLQRVMLALQLVLTFSGILALHDLLDIIC
jgi:hypothetical protein